MSGIGNTTKPPVAPVVITPKQEEQFSNFQDLMNGGGNAKPAVADRNSYVHGTARDHIGMTRTGYEQAMNSKVAEVEQDMARFPSVHATHSVDGDVHKMEFTAQDTKGNIIPGPDGSVEPFVMEWNPAEENPNMTGLKEYLAQRKATFPDGKQYPVTQRNLVIENPVDPQHFDELKDTFNGRFTNMKVDLDSTESGTITAHQIHEAYIDENGQALFETNLGRGKGSGMRILTNVSADEGVDRTLDFADTKGNDTFFTQYDKINYQGGMVDGNDQSMFIGTGVDSFQNSTWHDKTGAMSYFAMQNGSKDFELSTGLSTSEEEGMADLDVGRSVIALDNAAPELNLNGHHSVVTYGTTKNYGDMGRQINIGQNSRADIIQDSNADDGSHKLTQANVKGEEGSIFSIARSGEEARYYNAEGSFLGLFGTSNTEMPDPSTYAGRKAVIANSGGGGIGTGGMLAIGLGAALLVGLVGALTSRDDDYGYHDDYDDGYDSWY